MYEPIEIAPEPPKPDLPGHVGVYPSMDEIIDAVGADLFVQAQGCVRTFGDFQLMVSGSPLLDGLYRRLMYDPNYRELPWTRTHLWMTDESAPQSGPEGPQAQPRFTMVREWIVDNSDLPAEQTHAIDPSAALAASTYENVLTDTLGWREKGHDRPDFVVLVMEREGLAPLLDSDPVGSSRLVNRIAAPSSGSPLFTLSPEIIRAARCVAIVAAGEVGAAGVRSLGSTARLDAIRPVGGEMRWYLDAESSVEAARLARG